MAKVTMQDIANALSVSRITVWKVFNEQQGVSDALRTQIIKKAQEMGYAKSISDPVLQPGSIKAERTVSVIVSRPDSSMFWTNTIHRMAQALSAVKINLLYTYVPSTMQSDYTLPGVLTNGTAEAVVVLNVYDAVLLRMINTLPIPKVFLDTVPEVAFPQLDGDLFLLEGKETLKHITNFILDKGLSRIGFIGDTTYARTNADRYEGFLSAMSERNIPVLPEYCMTGKLGIYSYKEDVGRFLDQLPQLPEAFVCVSDYVVHFLKQYLSEYPGRVPNGIYVTGYDYASEYTDVFDQITSADVKTSLLGKRLASQLQFRLDTPEAPFELTYITPEIIYRDSLLY